MTSIVFNQACTAGGFYDEKKFEYMKTMFLNSFLINHAFVPGYVNRYFT